MTDEQRVAMERSARHVVSRAGLDVSDEFLVLDQLGLM